MNLSFNALTIRGLIILIAFLWLSHSGAQTSNYDYARELYKEGPTKAAEIIELLRRHLDEEPSDEKALKLLGITQFGGGQNMEALVTIERVIDLIEKDDRISAQMLMLKARALFALDRRYDCKKILEVYWAFWQDDDELEKLYEWYWEQVKTAVPPIQSSGEQGSGNQPTRALDSKAQ